MKNLKMLALFGISMGLMTSGVAEEQMSPEMRSFYEQLTPDAKQKFMQLDDEHRRAAMQITRQHCGAGQCGGLREQEVQKQTKNQAEQRQQTRQ